MKLIIDIPDEMYQKIKETSSMFIVEWRRCSKRINYALFTLFNAVKTGTPLPKGHGRLIDKDHMIARLEAASKFYGGENADAFDERFSHGLKEAAIKVAEEPTIIEADKGE